MKIRITFDRSTVQEPIIANIILETGIAANVEQAMIDGEEGWALLTLDDGDGELFLDALKKRDVQAYVQKNAIIHNRDECVDCGLCISLCQKHVFSFDDNWCLKVNADLCVLCGRCATFCPQRALNIQKE
ncbi:MAG TPA: 4Fe-4S binding protein [Methanocorpusculum sp.]|nr:4Fe-4S binding protein [Methanocorpusculum sp.]HJJ40453.1 4Fe-4S binding protein [Methanocorpusculum sp.]HJJ56909.1 4Fe-4S binding protein [Methanocorpusculum sp.]